MTKQDIRKVMPRGSRFEKLRAVAGKNRNSVSAKNSKEKRIKKTAPQRFTTTPSPIANTGGKHIKVPSVIRPRNEYGQNFLSNQLVLEKELEYATVGPEDTVLEIGPGTGNLTELLSNHAKQVHAIEIDEQFMPILKGKQQRHANLNVIWGDATRVPWPECDKVVANLPYNVALTLIFRLLEHRFHTGVVIIQKRMAQRLAARPGQPGYSRISVIAQRVAGIRYLETVGRHQFTPPPAVESAMLRVRPTRPNYPIPDEAYFRTMLEYAFLRREQPLGVAFRELGEQGKISQVINKGLPIDLRDTPVKGLPGHVFGRVAQLLYDMDVYIPEIDNELKRRAQAVFR